MPVQIVKDGRVLNAFLSGEIDHHTAPAVREKIDRFVIEYKPKVLRLYFRDISFMDSSGVGLVMGRYKQALNIGCEVEIFDLSERDEKIMKMSGLTKLVGFKKTPVAEKK